jgi:hypothetical protein
MEKQVKQNRHGLHVHIFTVSDMDMERDMVDMHIDIVVDIYYFYAG